MNVEEEIKEQEDVNMMNVMMLSNRGSVPGDCRNGLSDDILYLDNCSTITTAKNNAFLKKLERC